MKGLVSGLLADGHYTLHTSSWDAGANAAAFAATFHGKHTGDGGPVPPTNKTVNGDYVYVVKMNADGMVSDLTKIWNDGHSLAQLGWV